MLKSILGDEGKPACQNCSSRNVSCRYAEWTFVSEGPFISLTGGEPHESAADAVQTTAAPSPSTPLRAGSASSYQLQPGYILPSHLPSPPIAPSPGFTVALSIGAGQSLQDNVQEETVQIAPWPSSRAGDEFVYEATTPSRWINGNLSQQGSLSARSALLRFRYQVVPWIDSNHCKSTFGPTMMTLARGNGPISDCITYCMRLRDEGITTAGADGYDSTMRRRLLDDLARESALTADIGRALVVMSDVFSTPPSQWAVISASSSVHSYGGEVSQSRAFGFVTEPLKTLLRLQLKIGKELLAPLA